MTNLFWIENMQIEKLSWKFKIYEQRVGILKR